MTATPIPRTVAMTVFGDMETSTLTELPRGRSPIASHVVPAVNPRWVQRTWQRVAEEVRQGHQAYVVCPRIGDDENGEAGEAVPAAGAVDEEDWQPGEPGDDGRWTARASCAASSVSCATCAPSRPSRGCGSRCCTAGWRPRTRTR